MLTWAFQFEDQHYFDDLRSPATNGVDKPVLNFFRMAGLMRGNRVEATSSGSIPLDTMLAKGVRENSDVDVLATRDDRVSSIMIWNYHDDDVLGPNAPIVLSVQDLPANALRVLVTHYRIDASHSNAYSVWKRLGSPQSPTADQQGQPKGF